MKQKFKLMAVSILIINFIGQPVQASEITGTISNISANKSSVNAGNSIDISFDVALSQLPTSPFSYSVYISGVTDENGDSWTTQQWSAPARLESGDQLKGNWSATVLIDSNAYTGSYIASVSIPSKQFNRATGIPISISGRTAPIPTSSITGTISKLTTSTLTLKAGSSYDFNFNVNLSSTPSSLIGFIGAISATVDANGDPWTEESWWNKAILVSGNETSGYWKVSISIPSSAYTGSYIFSAGSSFSKLVTSKESLNITIDGVAATPAIAPYYTFSKQSLASPVVVRGNYAVSTFHLSTNDPQVQTPACVLDGAGDYWSNATLVSGSKMDGRWNCSLLVPTSTTPSVYNFHIAVVGYANKNKNEERVILSLQVVANAADLLGPASNSAFISTVNVGTTLLLTSDTIGNSIPHQASSTPVARIFIPQGSGTVTASVTGPGLLSSSNLNAAGRVLILTRSSNLAMNLYLFPDGTQGRSTISITVSGQANIKTVNFGNLGGVSPTPTPKPTPTKSSSSGGGSDESDISEDNGVEEDPYAELAVSKIGSRYLISINSNLDQQSVQIRATKKGSSTIRFERQTNSDGNLKFATTRKLSRYTLTVYLNGDKLNSIKVK
jgi:hypothetical protein